MNTKVIKKKLWIIAAVLLAAFCAFTSIFSVKADESSAVYTDVMTDLQLDNSFNAEEYPANGEDYSLQVIQIAESTNKELFVYVYQPSAGVKDLTATTIRMSIPVVGLDSTWKDYSLTLLNKDGVFQKYKVEGITVSSESIRYYDITAIHRQFDGTIDSSTNTNVEQTTNEVVFDVAQLWTAQTHESGSIAYTMKTTEVIHITVKVVGFIRYLDGYVPFYLNNYTDSHFVAFSTDRKIDDLLEADIAYATQSYRYVSQLGRVTETYGEEVEVPLCSIEKQNVGSNTDEGIFGKKYEWYRIEETSAFLNENEEDITFTDGATSDLEKCDWILRFYESDYEEGTAGNAIVRDSTLVSKVTILRLKFITDGKTYNLGVVDNKQAGSEDPLGTADTKLDDFLGEMEDLLVIAGGLFLDGLLIVVSVIIFIGICVLLFKLVRFIIKKIFNGNDG